MKRLQSTFLLAFVMIAFGVSSQTQQPTKSQDKQIPALEQAVDISVSQDGVPLGACSGNCATQEPNEGEPEDGSGQLAATGHTYQASICGLNYVQASERLGQRFNPAGVPQPATFNITGMPPCAVIEQAYLWSGTSGSGLAVTATITNPLAVTNNYPMTVIGSDIDKCWGYGGTHTYRADVTAAISGNGAYQISGLPTNPPTSGEDTDGATLFIIYSDPTATFEGHLIIDDGCAVTNGGTYTHTMTGFSACAASTFSTGFTVIADIQFNGSTMTINGTNAPYTFNWWNYTEVVTNVTNGQATADFTFASAGDCYNFAVSGLYYQTTTCVTCTPPPALTVTSTTIDATCGNCDGEATVNATGGNTPYTYQWDAAANNQITQTATGLCPGTYDVTVTDATGCNQGVQTVTIVNNGGFTQTFSNQVNPTCPGACDGTATVTANGGVPPYTYQWAANTGPNGTGLCDGWNLVTITDAAGCFNIDSVQLTDPVPITFVFSQVDETCAGSCDGQATVIPSGGTGIYTYTWMPAPGAGQGTASASLMCGGNYTITVTDNNGCSHDTSFTINTVNAMTSTLAETPSSCSQFDGTASVTSATGGQTPYTYMWDAAANNQTTATATGLLAGNYCVTITDLNGCFFDTCITVSGIPGPTISAPDAMTSCFNGCDGTSTATAVSGTTPYTFVWSTFPQQMTATATGLCAGNYNVTVADQNGCTDVTSITVAQPSMVTIQQDPDPDTLICIGGTATMSATANGGTPGYTFVWDNGNLPGNGPHNVSPQANQCYDVFALDQNLCSSDTVQVCINLHPPLDVIASTDVSVCDGDSATLNALGSGGNGGPYTYSWSNATFGPQNTVTPTGYPTPAQYIVTFSDGCTTPSDQDTVNVLFYPTPTILFSSNMSDTCAPGNFLFINNTVNSQQCVWDFGDGGTAFGCIGISHLYPLSGSYDVTLTVTSGDGCTNTLTQPQMITVHPNPIADFLIDPNPTTVLDPEISFTDNSIGVISSWQWSFYNSTGSQLGGSIEQNPEFLFPDVVGEYPVELSVLTNQGCYGDTTLYVIIEGVYQFWAPNAFTPDGDGLNDRFFPKGLGINPDEYKMLIFNRWGELIYESEDLNEGWDGTARKKGGRDVVQGGVYVYRIETVSDKLVPENFRYLGHVTLIK